MLQKSLAGLCCSILHGLLQSCPEFIQLALPDHWERIAKSPLPAQFAPEISVEEVQTALVQLIRDKKVYAKNRFCLFIDGLDEYEQTTRYDYKTVVNMLRTWVETSCGNLKCVSSREYNVFMNAFSNEYRLRLHELTLYDMRGYVRDKLSDLPSGVIKESLIVAVSNRADGIFFWVALVVQSMREGIEDGVNVNDLKDLVNSLPTGLENLFHHILFKLGEQKRVKAYEAISMLSTLKAGDYPPLSLFAYSFYDHYKKDERFAFRGEFFAGAKIDIDFIENRAEFARKQLRANCGGLLESSPPRKGCTIGEVPGGKIEYTHRSVPEYLQRLRDQGEMKAVSHGFNAIDACHLIPKCISTTAAQLYENETLHVPAQFSSAVLVR